MSKKTTIYYDCGYTNKSPRVGAYDMSVLFDDGGGSHDAYSKQTQTTPLCVLLLQ